MGKRINLDGFDRVDNKGERATLELGVRSFIYNEHLHVVNDNFLISPYSDLIPIEYLLTVDALEFSGTRGYNVPIPMNKNKTREGVFGKGCPFISGLFTQVGENSERDDRIKATIKRIRAWLEYDKPYDMLSAAMDPGYDWTETGEKFYYFNNVYRNHVSLLTMRSYRLGTGIYSAFLNNNSDRSRGNHGYTPEVMAVVRPEDYVYHKYNILVNNTLDLSKVVILINNELFTTKHRCPAFKSTFREYMLPKIEETACNVWRVPRSYIQNSCFVPKWKPEGPLKERVASIDKVVEGLYAHISKGRQKDKEFAEIITGSSGILDAIRDGGPSISITTGATGMELFDTALRETAVLDEELEIE